METPAKLHQGEYVIKVKADTSEVEEALAALKPRPYGVRLAALDRALSLTDRHGLHCTPGQIVATAAVFEHYLRDGETPTK